MKNVNYIERIKSKLKNESDLKYLIKYEKEHNFRCQTMSDNDICKYLLNRTRDGRYYFNNVIDWINTEIDTINKCYSDLETIVDEYGYSVDGFLQWMVDFNEYFDGWSQDRLLLYLFRKNKLNEYNWQTTLRIFKSEEGYD